MHERHDPTILQRTADIIHKTLLPSVLSRHYRETFEKGDWQTRLELATGSFAEMGGLFFIFIGNPIGLPFYVGGKILSKTEELNRYVKQKRNQ